MEILFFLLWKEWMVFVRYKRVERIKIRQEAVGRKVENQKGRLGGLMDEWNNLKNETGN